MLELKNISFKIKAADGLEREILKEINLKFSSGKIIGLTGPNGSGKSTLAQIIMGIEQPSDGEIWWQKQNITKLDETERAKLGISLSFQQPAKFKGLTVRDLLEIAAGEYLPKAKVADLLLQVGLDEENYSQRELNENLSGGERKRIEIATILAKNATVMIFDEPEAGIDLWSFEDLVRVLASLKNKKRTIVVITHQQKILELVDEIFWLKNGQIIEKGEREKMLKKIKSNLELKKDNFEGEK